MQQSHGLFAIAKLLVHFPTDFCMGLTTVHRNCAACDCVYRHVGRFIGNHYGAGSGQIWLDDVQCAGTEPDLAACIHGQWGRHSCSHRNDVSISCLTGTVRTLLFKIPTTMSHISLHADFSPKILDVTYPKNNISGSPYQPGGKGTSHDHVIGPRRPYQVTSPSHYSPTLHVLSVTRTTCFACCSL